MTSGRLTDITVLETRFSIQVTHRLEETGYRNLLVPVQNSHGEAQLTRDEAISKRELTTRYGKLRHHFT